MTVAERRRATAALLDRLLDRRGPPPKPLLRALADDLAEWAEELRTIEHALAADRERTAA